MTHARHIVVVTALLSALAGRAVADDWTMGGYDASLAHRTAERSTGSWSSQPWSWTAPHGAQLVASPVVTDGVAVVAAMDGNVYGLAASNGRLLWQFTANDGVQGTPAVLNGKVFVISLDGKLYALHLASGRVAWQKALGGLGRSSPVVAGGSLIVARGFPGDTLLRLDPSTGNTVWETAAGSLAPFSNSAAASDGTRLIIGANEGHYLAFDLATGKQLWKYEAGGIVNLSAPLLVGGRAYFLPGGASGRLHAVDAATGAAVAGWPIDLPAPAADVAGTSLGREFSVSSVAATNSSLIVDFRSDDFLDTDKDGTADQFLLRETVAAFDMTSGALAWQQANGRQVAGSFNDIPKNWLCPTPAVYGRMGTSSAAPYLLAASTLTASVRALDAGSGAVLATLTATGPSGASPVLANGRSFVATTAGTLHSWASRGNLPPGAPALTDGATRAVNNVAPVVHWAGAMDPEGQTVTYQARLDSDGEILESWAYTITTGDTTWRVAANLELGKTYVVAVRARDSQGAWSDWSAPQILTVEETPPVSVGSTPQPSLAAALMTAQPGDVVHVGAGRMRIGETIRVPAGVTMEGAGPQRTVIDATGRDTGIALDGSAAGQPTQVRSLTVTGARTGISVGAVHDARLTNVIVRDSADAGVNVGAAATALLRNGTLVANGRAVVSFGSLLVKNSLVTGNYTGLVADHAEALVSQFNDVSGNAVADYQGLVAGQTDLSAAVSFLDYAGRDLHLPAQQSSTDRGDPGDDFSAEPAPNGGRINLGAFGGTSEAELSAAPDDSTTPPSPSDGSADGGVPPGGTPDGAVAGGGGANGATPDGGPPSADAGQPTGGTSLPSSPHPPSPTTSPTPGASASGSGGGCDMTGSSRPAPLTALLTVLALLLLAVRRVRPRSAGVRAKPASSSRRWRGGPRTGWVIAGTLALGGLWATPAQAIVRVQYCTGANNSAAATSVTCTWPSPTTAGNGLLAVLVESSNNGFVSPTTEGTGWTMGNAQKDAGNLHIRNFINLNASSRSGTVTWTFSPATNAAVYMVEYSNLLTSNAQDMNASNTGTSSTASTGTTSTLGQAIEVGIGVVAVPGSSLTFSGESITEVTEKASTDATYGFNAAFLETITNSTTGVGTNATISGSGTWVGFMNTFKGTAGGTGGGTAGLWVGSQTGHLWSNTANWSNGALPASTDTVVLNSTGNNAMVIDTTASVAGFNVQSGYTNSITQSGSNNMFITGDLTLAAASGTFTAPSGLMTIGGTFNNTSGMTFAANGGSIMMTGTSAKTFASNGVTFNNLFFNDGLIGYWKLDETTIGTAADASGNFNSLTAYNSPTASTSLAPLDFVDVRSAAFTGVNGNNSTTPHFRSGTMPSTLQPSVVTMSAWYKATGTASAGGEIVSGSNRYSLRVYSTTQIKVTKQTGNATWVELTATVSNPLNGAWHHIAGVITASGMTAYFDGAQVASNTDTSAIYYGTSVNTAVNSGAVGYLNIGRNQDTANYEFTGNIDDVRLWNRALSGTDIAALAAGTVPTTSLATYTLTGSPTVSGDLVIESGMLGIGINTIGLGGDFLVNTGGFSVSTGGLNCTGSSTGNYIYTGGSTLNDLTVSGTGSWTLSDQTQVNLTGDLNISAGTLTSTPGKLFIQGAFNKTGGTFTHNSGTVMLASPTSQTFATNGTTFNNLIINDGLVGYWKLDENTGTTTSDSSGYGNSGTLTNAPTWTTSLPGLDFKNTSGVTFNGTNNYIDIAATATSTNAAFSACSWVKFNSLTGYQELVTIDGTTIGGFFVEKDSSSNKFAFNMHSADVTGGATNYQALSTTVATTGTWYHVCGVFTGSALRIYVNGAQEGSDVAFSSTWLATGHTVLGSCLFNGARTSYLNGSLDDVRIYNRVLTAVEVKSLANGDLPGSKVATHTMTGAPTVAGDLTIASGELAVSTNNMTVTGNWYNYGGRFTPGVQTVTFNGSGSTVLQSANQVFNNITYSGAGTLTLNDRLELDPGATFNITAGTVNLSSYTLRAGNLTRSAGTLTPSTSTVVLDGDSNATVTGNSFNNLRIEPVGATNLVGYWKLDENQGTTAHDYSTTNASLTLTNSPVWVDTGLPSALDFENAGAVTFDRTQSQSLAGSALVSAQMPSVVTMSAWYKATSVDTNGAEILSGGNRYILRVFSSTQIKIAKQTASATWVELLATVSNPLDGNWHHIAGVITSTGMIAYFDGAQVASNSDVSPIYYTSAGAMTIGTNPTSATYRFTGSIDDVRIYNTALSSSQIKTLYNGAYPAGMAGTPTYTLGASATVAGAFAVDNGTFNTGTGFTFNNSASSPAAVVNSGSYTVGTAASTFSPGLTISNDGTLTMVNSGGAVKIGSAKTLTIDGTLNASNTGATIQTAGGAGTYYSFKVGSTSTATPVMNITGLAVKNTDTNGMYINTVAGSTTTFTRFDNIAFSGGTGTQLLQIYSPSLYLFSNGCTFDSGTTASTTYNVTLTGDGSATETRALFGGATCASNKTSCESYDNDNDSNTDGVGDTSATNGAVVQWISAAQSDTNGTIEGFPTAAFDWSTFVYYSTYVLFHDVDSGTADRIYVRDASGNAKYSWDGPSGTDFVGAPRFDTASSVHYVYVATASGKVYRLIDNGSSLAQDNSGSWAGTNNPYDCSCTVTTPITLDSTNLYWGGILTSGSVNKVWTLAKSTRTLAASSPLTTTALVSGAAPALWVSTSTYMFVGESTHFDKLNVTSQALTTTNASPTGTVNGRITIVNNKLFGADTAGKLWVLDPSATGLTPFWTYHDDTNHNGCTSGVCAVTGSLYVDWLLNRAFYGDSDGHLYATYNSSGSTGAQITAGWPYRPGTSSEVYATAPFYNSGVLVAGTTTGNVYVIDINGGSGPVLLQTYKLGTSTKISGIGYDKTGANYLISAADPTTKNGDVFYIAAVTDPTPGSN